MHSKRDPKKIEVTKRSTSQPLTLYTAHIVAVEALADGGAMVFVNPTGIGFETSESRDEVNRRIAAQY